MKKEIHVCTRETEIELVKQNLVQINEKLDNIHKHIVGNGRPGLLERVSNNEIVLKVGYTIIGLILSILTFFSAIS